MATKKELKANVCEKRKIKTLDKNSLLTLDGKSLEGSSFKFRLRRYFFYPRCASVNEMNTIERLDDSRLRRRNLCCPHGIDNFYLDNKTET